MQTKAKRKEIHSLLFTYLEGLAVSQTHLFLLLSLPKINLAFPSLLHHFKKP